MNKTAERANQFIKAIEEMVQPIVEAAVIAAAPEIGLPVVKQIVAAVEHALEDKLTKYVELGTTFIIIDAQVEGENTRLGKAQNDLILAIQSGNMAAIDAAQKEFDDAQSALTHDDGSASPH